MLQTKKIYKRILFGAIFLCAIAYMVFVYAEPGEEAVFNVRTVNVFPDSITSDTWSNVESLYDQKEYDNSIYQNFDRDTSAYIQKIGTKEPSSNPNTQIAEPEPETVESVLSSSSTESGVDVVSGQTSEDAGAPEVVEPESAVVTEPVPEAAEETESEIEPVQESEIDEVETISVGQPLVPLFGAVFAQVRSLYALTQAATTTSPELPPVDNDVSESDTEEALSTPEPIVESVETVEEVAAERVASSTDAVDTTVSADESSTEAPVASSTSTNFDTGSTTPDAMSADDASTTATTTGEQQPATTTPNEITCGRACDEYTITLQGFDIPVFDENTTLDGGHIRASMAARQRVTYLDEDQEIIISYSFDGGGTWSTGGVVDIDEEISNSLNGGHFLFALPNITSVEDLDDLVVTLTYRGKRDYLAGIYVDSVWLELFAVEEVAANPYVFDLGDDGYQETVLTGDELVVSETETIAFNFTDNNDDETLIIKSDQRLYQGVTEATTYFNVTNTSDESDAFSVQVYFPNQNGEVIALEEWQQNKPKQVVVPEYRPYVYHCEAVWEAVPDPTLEQARVVQSTQASTTLSEDRVATTSEIEVNTEANATQAPADTTASTTVPDAEASSSENTTGSSSDSVAGTAVLDDVAPTSTIQIDSDAVSTSSQALRILDTMGTLLTSTIEAVIGFETELVTDTVTTEADDAADISVEEILGENTSATSTPSYYRCGDTDVTRVCEVVDGEGTACRVSNQVINEHEVTNFVSGWVAGDVAVGEKEIDRSLFNQVKDFLGFGIDRKAVPKGFVPKNYSEQTYDIAPGETRYFRMDIGFEPLSTGEYYIEAIGENSLYGLLDPFFSSQWQYRLPIDIDNQANASDLTEHQVFLELDSSLTDFWSNVADDGADIRFAYESVGSNEDDWYDTSWNRRMAITVDSSQVNSGLTDFPLYVDLSDLGSEFFANVQSGGDDIRVTESDGTTELAIDLVAIDTGAESGELHFSAANVNDLVDTVFYIYFDNPGANGYSPGDTYGRENVWGTEYIATYHLEEDSAGTGNSGLYQDATSNDYDADDEVDSSGKTGKIGQGQEIRARDAADDDYILFPSDVINGENIFTASFWLNTSQTGDQALLNAGASNEYIAFLRNTNLTMFDGSATDIFTLDTDVTGTGWKYFTIIRDATSNEWLLYVDGVADNENPLSETMSALSVPDDCFLMGLEQDGSCLNSTDENQHLDGLVDEVRFRNTIPSADEVAATFINQSTTTDFYATSSVEELNPVTLTELDFWVQRFSTTTDEADVWLQVDTIPGGASTTVYMYYGNSGATSASDEWAPFTYATTTDIYYVVDTVSTAGIVVYSLIDDNVVQLDSDTPVSLDKGETTTLTGYTGSSVIRVLGPISATINSASADAVSPISFATTTHIVASNRNTQVWHTHAPFSSTTVRVYHGAAGSPDTTVNIATGTASAISSDITSGSEAGIIEATSPVLVYHRDNGGNDAVVAYPPTFDDLYGVNSQNVYYSSPGTLNTSQYCYGEFSGATNSASTTATARGFEVNDDGVCDNSNQGNGDGMRITSQDSPVAAIQQADGDGGDTSSFLRQREFATEYFIPTAADYVTVVCSPEFGTSTIEVRDTAGSTVDSGTCTPPTSVHPSALRLANGITGNDDGNSLEFNPGYSIVSTNDVPFYAMYETNIADDEVNVWGAVQARKFTENDIVTTFGVQENTIDAQYNQLSYRWFENAPNLTPTSSWPLDSEGTTVGEGEAITGQGAISVGDVLRLRMNLEANSATGTATSTAFKLQYVAGETCAAIDSSAWVDVGAIGSTTAAFSGYNNSGLGDGTTLASTTLATSTVFATYEESNLSSKNPIEIGINEVAEWDWVITNSNATVNTDYCFRMVRASEQELSVYTTYPQLLTSGPPAAATLLERFDNEHASSTRPTLQFVASDLSGDDLHYQVQIDDDVAFGSPLLDQDSENDFLQFQNIAVPSDKAPFNSGQVVQYDPPSDLTSSTTYWWRVRSSDPDGSNTFSEWSTPFSFTINESISVSEWFQTTDEQFETNSLISATTSGSGSVELDVGGGSNIGEYGSITVTNGATGTVNLINTYTNPVVTASVEYSRTVSNGDQPSARVFNKTGTSFEVLSDDFEANAPGTSTVHFVVMEAGEYLMDDGDQGVRVFATSTSVSGYIGSSISGDPGLDITFPTSFGGAPSVLTMVTTNNDPDWILSTVYDGNDVDNPPTASQMGVYLQDNLASDGHTAAEDIDIIAFDQGIGTNNGVAFDIFNTGIDSGGAFVDDTADTFTFSQTFSGPPGVTAVQQLTMLGAQGGYAMVDIDTPVTSTGVDIAIEEGGTNGGRTHADENVAVVVFENASGTIIRAGNAQITSTAIDFDDADVGNSWGEVSFTDSGDVTYHVEYQSGSGFVDIPDSALAGNSTGFTTSPINILDLDTDTYNEIRIIASMSGVSPELFDWTVTWGQRVDIPSLGDPFDNEKISTTTPTFDFSATDPQGDDLEYEISYSTSTDFTSSTTVNSTTTPANFANLSTPSDTGPFNSGNTITYTIPAGSALLNGETYWWRVRAKDPDGGDSFSPWSEPDSFTVDTATVVSTWFQTTQEQFEEGTLDGAIASTSDAVTITSDIGEYGSTTVTNNSWSTINTSLTYNNMVVVASPQYAFNSADNGRTVQVRNKTNDSFEIKADNYTESLTGSTDIDYIVMEAGDWLITDGDTGTRIVAGTASDVTEVEGSIPGYTGGRLVDFDPDFAGTPGALTTVSSANGSKWVATVIDDGTQTGEITAASMNVALGISLDTDTVREAEDIDYVAFSQDTGTNNGVLFETFNTGNVVTENDAESTISFTQTFTAAPQVVVLQNNGTNGADGGFAQQDTDQTTTAATLFASIAEIGASAGNHATEVVSAVAFEAGAGAIQREAASGGGLTGTIASEEILFSDGAGPKFEQALFATTSPGNSSTSVQVQYLTGTSTWVLIPDSQIPGNSTGTTTSPIDLTNVDIVSFPVIRLLATLQCDGSNCPTLEDWTVEWSEGVPVSGTLQEYDRSTNVTSGTVRLAVNGTLHPNTGSVSAGNWTINNVTAFAGDTVTVFVDGAADADEAVNVFVYDGIGDMTNIELFEQHLTFSADEKATTSNHQLRRYDNSVSGDEDIFFDVTATSDLEVCDVALTGCSQANLFVTSGHAYIPATSSSVEITTHDFINNGVVELDTNTLRVGGSWDNNATISVDDSTVIFSATNTSETIDDADTILDFNNLTFGETSGTANWKTFDRLDLAGDLVVDFGTFDRASSTITVAGDITTNANGIWSGLATTTFDGNTASNWIDNSTGQDIGYAVIDGSAKTITLGSDVLASTVTIGADDTLSAGSSHTLEVQGGNFINNNIFSPQTGTVLLTATGTNITVDIGGSSFYALTASSSNSNVVFTEANLLLLDNLTIATGTVTLPTGITTISGSFLNTGGIFAHNNASVVMSGSGSELVTQNGSPFLNAFYDLEFSGSGDWTYTDATATTSNEYTISNGSVTFPSGTLSVGRDFTVTGSGAFVHNDGEVVFQILADDQVVANGSAFNDVRFRDGGSIREGGFDEAWAYREMITINASEIDEDLTNFPVYLDLADFGSTFFTRINTDGSDIRITESDGVSEVPREIVSASTTLESGEVYFSAPTLSSTTNSVFYIYYGNALATDYAVTDTYGAENVWDSDFLAVYHMESEDAVDSTSFDRDAVAVGDTPTTAAGRFGTAVSITDNGGSDYLDLQSDLSELNGLGEMTVSAWANVDDDANDDVIFTRGPAGTVELLWDNINGSTNNDTWTFNVDSTSSGGNRVDAAPNGISVGDTWQYVTGAMQGANRYIYVDGVLRNTNSGPATTLRTNTSGSYIGFWAGSTGFDYQGLIDEYRISRVERSAEWIAAEYSNMSTTTDFYTVTTATGDLDTRTLADANLTALGNVVIEGDQVQFPSNTFTVGGSFDNDSQFVAGTGNILFDSVAGSETISFGTSSPYDLTFDSSVGDWTIVDHATTSNNVTLTDVGDFTLDAGQVMVVGGSFTTAVGGASTTWTGSTLALNSDTDYAINIKTAPADTYDTLVTNGDTDVSLWNSNATTYTTNASSSIYSQDHADNDGDLYIFGDYERTSGTEYWSYATDFDGEDLASSTSERVANVRVAADSIITATSSGLQILGGVGATTTIDSQSGTFAFTARAASATIQYASFTGTNADGFSLLSSTTVHSFEDSLFTIGPGTSAMTIDGSTIDEDPGAQYFRVSFDGGTGANVTLSGSPNSFWWFREGQGDRYGEAFDNVDGDPGSIRWDDSSYTIDISGVVYTDDGSTPLGGPTCDGSTNVVQIVVDGGTYTDFVPCSGLDGSYSFSNVSYIGDPNIVVYLNTDGGINGSVVTKTPTANITDLDIYANRVITRHEDVAPLTIADMTSYDEADDSDLRFVAATGSPDTLIVRPDTELLIASSSTFRPDGTITLQSSGSGQVYDASLHIDNNGTFVASGTEAYAVGGSFFLDEGGTFTAASSTVTFTATTTGKTITGSSTITFNTIDFTGVGGGWHINTDIVVTDDISVATGTVTGTGDILIPDGTFSGAGLVSLGDGTVTIEDTTVLGGVQGWTFNNLTLGDATTNGTTTRFANATTSIDGVLTVTAGHVLELGTADWDFGGTGVVITEAGTINRGTSVVRYSGDGTVHAMDYYNLDLNASAGSVTQTFAGVGLQVFNDLTVGGQSTTTVTANTNDPLIAVSGNVLIRPNGTLVGSDSNTLSVAGDWDNNGAFTSSGGLVDFISGDSFTIAAGNSTFGEVLISGSGALTVTENATSTGAWTLASSSDSTVNSGVRLAIGGTFTNASGGAATTWTGSTLHLFGGDYEVNASTTADEYATLSIGADTDIRIWNSSALATAVDTSGSLYSMNHASNTGELYVYGNYVEDSRADYWSYDTDFDGTDLSGGNERLAQVFIEGGGSATWRGGSLEMHGSTTASTTVQNQGSGTYSLQFANGGGIDGLYAVIRDLDSTGVIFSGAPVVADFSRIDLLAEIDSATTITVGGTAINTNPAQNFENNIFNFDTGVTGAVNVTATGTAVSSWRYTQHSGNLDGEANDVDPGGDPGYVVWGDSANVITISGTVYEADRTTRSNVCDDVTPNVRLAIDGVLTANASSSCSSVDGSYTISGVSFSANDALTLYIDGESEQAANVSQDPISSISDMDLYENHVIVRHENTDPLTIVEMAVWDSSDDADIPFTAVDAGSDTVSLPSDFALVVWNSKEFAPGGDVTISGGGAGASYDGSLEVFENGTFTGAAGENHTVGGSIIFGTTTTFTAGTSQFTLTTDGASRSLDTNSQSFYDITFNGSGSWVVVDPTFTVGNTATITAGALTLPAGTTTIAGSFRNTGGSFDANDGLLQMTGGSTGLTVEAGGSDFNELVFDGGGAWSFIDTNATSTNAVIIENGSVTLPSGVFAVDSDFINNDTILHNSGTLLFSSTTGTSTLTQSGDDLFSLTTRGAGVTVMSDASATLRGDLTVLGGALNAATNTLSIGGSLDATGGVLNTANNTILFNSSDTGETIDPGVNEFYNLQFANGAGGWTFTASATTTNNFTILTANDFTVSGGNTLSVAGVFTNAVGGSATTWLGSTLRLLSAADYTINTKSSGGDQYDALFIAADTDIRAWDSAATTTTVTPSGSYYSQDHAGNDGDLYIFGDYHRATSTDYWNYATDFDGAGLGGGSERVVNVYIASGATTTIDGGALQIIGAVGASSTVQNQGSGTYALRVTSGTFSGSVFALRDLDAVGLSLTGSSTVVSSLDQGDFELAVNGGALITLSSTTLNANPSKVITGAHFATTSAITGTNVDLDATTTNAWTFVAHTGNLSGENYDIDGITECGSIRWDDSSCLVTEQTHYRWRNDDGGEGVPDSEWFDASWDKRQRVRIENADNSVYTDMPIKISVAYDADMQSDFEDLRFTSDDGLTEIDYWIEEFTASTDATVWVEVPSLPAQDTATVFMYYDNVLATTTSSSTAVFTFVDDFEDNNISEYIGDTGLFNVGTTFNFGGSYGLDNAGSETSRATDGIFRTDASTTPGTIIRFMQYVDTSAGANNEACTLFAVQSPGTDNRNYGVCLEQFNADRMTLARDIKDTDTSGVQMGTVPVTYSTGWYEVEIDWQVGGQIDVALYTEAGALVATTSSSSVAYTDGHIGFTYWDHHGGWDSYTVRPRMDSKPTIRFGTEQTDGGANWSAALDTAGDDYVIGDVARLRVAIENSGLDITSQLFELEYAAKGTAPTCEAVSTASYVTVPPQSTCTGSPICMQTSSNVTNGAATTDLLFGTNGDFTAGEIVEDPSNETGSLDVLSNEYTEIEYAITPTADTSDDSYCLRVTNDGDALDSYTRVAELVVRFDPSISALSLNGGADITLTPGATTTVLATGTVTDLNGFADLSLATSTVYRSGVGETCALDNNNCYRAATPQCSFSGCSGNTCNLSCSVDIFYHAEPTDIGTFAGESWRAFATVEDLSGATATATAPSVDLVTLRAIELVNSSAINYGALAVSSTTESFNPTTTVENIGNDDIDISLEGTDLTDGAASAIDVAQQLFATSTFTYSSCVFCTNLATTTIPYEVDLVKPTSTTPIVTDVLYWGIEIPFGTANSSHSGVNTFYAVDD